ncbi:MAG TPA: Ig-like domain repeat protein [Terriglobales bacterium]
MSCSLRVIRLSVLVELLVILAGSGFAQNPLDVGNNYLLTGDYVVAGAQGIMTNFSNGYAVGTFTIPDPNPGITGVKQVPAGAQIVDALLFWETVENSSVQPGQPGSGQNGFFRPVFNGGPAAPGYPISGINRGSTNTVTWSSGGCTGTSTGKVTRTYRADVIGYLPQDANGNVLANGTFEVRLPSVGNPSAPFTLGATLVYVYRVVSPIAPAPLNSIVIYEGAFAPTGNSLTMMQTLQFYDAGNDQPKGAVISRLTHIAGSGQSNKYQVVYLNNQQLPSLYPNGEPPFPGYYGRWDNPTWTFPAQNLSNPVHAGDFSAQTEVIPTPSNQGCLSWSAVIFSTTVQDSALDGIPDVWKQNQGYTDIGTGQFVSLADDPLPGNNQDPPKVGQQDVFIQLDYVTEPDGTSFQPTTQVLQAVRSSFLAHNIHLHFTGFNPIPEGECTDGGGQPTCSYPNQPGVTAWRAGLEFVKNYLIPLPAFPGANCTQNPQECGPRFPPAQRNSYHYAVFGDSVGGPSWSLADGSLSKVVASGTTVTFTTSAAFPTTGMPFNAYEGVCPNGRVSISDAITNPKLNGIYCVQNILDSTHFTIQIPSVINATYTHATDPNLSVANGQATSRSGTSDLGGAVSLITLGHLWGADGQSPSVQEGTLMHEFGHTAYLPHGGAYYTAANPYMPTFEANCKTNYQSVMSYMFQVDLLDKYDPVNKIYIPGFLDFSEDTLNTLTIGSLSSAAPLTKTDGTAPTYGAIKWYAPGTPVGSPATRYCDGTPLPANPPQMVRLEGTASSISPAWTASQNIDFDPPGSPQVLHGFNDWANLDLRQVGATGSSYVLGGAFPTGGGAFPTGGGAFPTGGGAFPTGGGAFPTGGGAFPTGGGAFPTGGGLSTGDITHETANSVTRSPRNLTATEAQSARTITLNWSAPTFGQIGEYKIYRSTDGGQTFPFLTSISGNPPATTYTDTVSCNTPNGYQYYVTAVLANTSQESVPSNTVTATAKGNELTGCYTNTPASVSLNDLSFGSSPVVQGTPVTITWTLQDDNSSDYANPYVNASTTSYPSSLPANSLYAIGPVSNNGCQTVTQGRTALVVNGAVQNSAGTFSQVGNTFTFTWSTDTFCAGQYTFELDTDSGQKETTAAALQLNIDINDQDNPHITTVALPGGTVGLGYNDLLTEDGGTAPFRWTVSGLPAGIAQPPAGSSTISGTTCVAGSYNSIIASVTDAKSNTGSRPLTLQINQANTTTSVTSNPSTSVFQQMVTFTVTVTPQYPYPCPMAGTVTLSDGGAPIASNLPLSGGMATFTTSALSVSVHSITASYSGDANFNPSNSGVWPQTVNPAQTQISISSVLPSTVFVNQPITVSYTFSVVAPGGSAPIPPSGNITVTASDGSMCAPQPATSGMCTLAPPPTTTGNVTFAINYPGDHNFVMSRANSNYTVNQLVFTTQPGNTGVGLTITPAVVVTAEDPSNNTLPSFIGPITLAIGSGPGTLSGTTTNNAVAGVATFSNLSINQIANGYTLKASPDGVVFDATSTAFNIDTLYVDNQGNFGTLDLASGVATRIAAGTAAGANGIDLTPGLQVYAYTASNQLMQITPSPLASTLVGTGSIPDQATTGATTDGSYFGIDAVTGILYSINIMTGATTMVGANPTGVAPVPPGCNPETSLSGSGTVLYYTVGFISGGNCNASTMNDTLYQVNPTTGATTAGVQLTVSGSGVNGFVGSAYVGGTLYGFTNTGQEYTINTGTGAATSSTNITPVTTIVGAGDSQ